MKRLYEILQQIQSTHFAKLWLFYRKHFNSDEDCLQFLYDAILFNPSSTTALPTLEQRLNQMATSEGELDETHTIPLQMLNIVQRLVSAAHDMDQIRRGQDVFKVIYLVTCAETLGELSDHKGSKLHLWKDFWANNCSCSDKKLIYSKFSIDSSFRESKIAQEDTFDSFEIFLYIMNEVRNSAIHDGAYWEHFFNNHGDEPLLFQLKVNLHRYKGDQKKLHTFLTELSYQEFENIFVRTSIRLIRNYLKQHTNQQEEPSYADA